MYQSVHKHYSNLISKKQGHWRSLGILMHNFNGVSFLVVNLIETPPCWSINKSSEHLRMNMGADNLFNLFNIITVIFSSIHALGKKKKKKNGGAPSISNHSSFMSVKSLGQLHQPIVSCALKNLDRILFFQILFSAIPANYSILII